MAERIDDAFPSPHENEFTATAEQISNDTHLPHESEDHPTEAHPPYGNDNISSNDGLSAAMDSPSQSTKKSWRTTKPPKNGKDGDVQRQIDLGGPGITEPLQLTMHNTESPIHIPPSRDKQDFFALDMQAAKEKLSNSDVSDRGLDSRTVRPFFRRIIRSVMTISDVSDIKFWENEHGDQMPLISSLPPTPESDKEYSRVKPELEKLFCDSFQVTCKPMENTSPESQEKYQHPTSTMRHVLSNYCNLKDGLAGNQDRTTKYFVSQNDKHYPKPITDPTLPCKVLVKVADLHPRESQALLSIFSFASRQDNRAKLLDPNLSNADLGAMVDELRLSRLEDPLTRLFRCDNDGTPNATNISGLLKASVKYSITNIDMDMTVDKPYSINYDECNKVLLKHGYEIDTIKIGRNAVKTKSREWDSGLKYRCLIYDKNVEGLQVPGKATEISDIDNKLHYTPNAATDNLKAKFANPRFQQRGMTRIEMKLTGPWSLKEVGNLLEYMNGLIKHCQCAHSMHDKLKLMDARLKTGSTVVVIAPSIYAYKIKQVQDQHNEHDKQRTREKMAEVPDAVVAYYRNTATSAIIGRTICVKPDGRKNTASFGPVCQIVANEAPCGRPVEFYIICGDGMDRYLRGYDPVVIVRRIQADKVADEPQYNRMHIPRVAGQPNKTTLRQPAIDIRATCGVDIDTQDCFKLALTNTPQDYENTRIRLIFRDLVEPAIQPSPFTHATRLYNAYDSLPPHFVPVTVGERTGEPANIPFFTWEGTDFAALSPKLADEISNGIAQQRTSGIEFNLSVRYSTVHEHIQWISASTPQLIRTPETLLACKLPVQEEPMRILGITLVPYGSGTVSEVDIQGEGTYRLPKSQASAFWGELADKGIASSSPKQRDRVDLESQSYFLKHPEQKSGAVKGGGNNGKEEFIEILHRQATFDLISKTHPRKEHKRTKTS
jgi:hypothetical protein